MLIEDLRSAHEDIERLEAAIAERITDEPKHIRNRLARDHEIANFADKITNQSERALHIYNNERDDWTREVQSLTAGDDPFEEFYKQLAGIKDFHRRNANEPVENLERAYKKPENGGPAGGFAGGITSMFTGEEAFGRFFDLTMLHEEFLNLPGIKLERKVTYLHYIDIFDKFGPPELTLKKDEHKMTDAYFSYVGSLADYLESFMRRSKPLENLDVIFRGFLEEFERAWEKGEVSGWESIAKSNGSGPKTQGTGTGIWCADCEKEFKNDNVYRAHLTGKKHIKAAAEREASAADSTAAAPTSLKCLRERAVAEREHRVTRLAASMQTVREDTRVNVERKSGMTDKERTAEIEALYAEDTTMTNGPSNGANGEGDDDDEEDGEKLYNPLKLPLSWDGKPIPFWLYKLHGLGVEFSCEICGNYVYMGRRAFDKHFSEQRHVYGLKCLGITQTGLFREITGIGEAERLWEKIQRDRETKEKADEGVIEMEDSYGAVMPWKVWDDLNKQGLL
ncbi:hypothetical protein B0A48_00613 [Cryoendolithus antarcticus]|uniref:Matrin-type domain-containing protein n=1 Tax=Cryoendolithus antarcticus TaxID=1507870 RepID=A0A1V8TV03_9PEZI|nr:hypothetical protein B0A48_00613 [Cryoendolithus antarcticus]